MALLSRNLQTKSAVRNTVARLLFAMGLTAPMRHGVGRLSIVTFHRVLPEAERAAYPYPGLVVTPTELDALLAYLARHFDCGTLARQHERLSREQRDDRPLLAVTFDDGQHDNYHFALPLLARHGIKATFFIPVRAIETGGLLWHDRLGFAIMALRNHTAGRRRLSAALARAGVSESGPLTAVENVVRASKRLPLPGRLQLVDDLEVACGVGKWPEFARPMTFAELANLAAHGHEVGSHSMTHCMMPECDDQGLAHEIGESRRVLEERLNERVESFCYPNGDVDGRAIEAVARAGYSRAVGTEWGSNARGADRFKLRRYDIVSARLRDASGAVLPAALALQMSRFYRPRGTAAYG
jgi:peptidoglycan/xylan/chitin deacetylase (PgdA/CDA1 family)